MFIAQLRKLHVGCVVKSMYLGGLLYADDMVLFCPSLRGLQCMLNNCVDTAELDCPSHSMHLNPPVWELANWRGFLMSLCYWVQNILFWSDL
jgi:hypothetical protein